MSLRFHISARALCSAVSVEQAGMEGRMKGKRSGGRLELSWIPSAALALLWASAFYLELEWKHVSGSTAPSRLCCSTLCLSEPSADVSSNLPCVWRAPPTGCSLPQSKPGTHQSAIFKSGIKAAPSALRFKWAWLPALLQPLRRLEIANRCFPHSAPPQLPTSSFFSSSSLLPPSVFFP